MSTKIEWTDETWNPVTGCTKVSQGCKNCYAERLWPKVSAAEAKREGWDKPRAFTDVRCHPERLEAPLHWKKPRRIFVNSMSDLFHEDVPFIFIDRVFAVMALCPQHTFQILTKRPALMLAYLAETRAEIVRREWTLTDCATRKKLVYRPFPAWPLPNVWLGVSVEDQPTADERIRLLLQTLAAIHFVSYEPALGPVRFKDEWLQCPGGAEYGNGFNRTEVHAGCCEKHARLNWLIAGGESGPNARPSHPDWFRSVRDQCADAGVAFFFKQWGEWAPRWRPDGRASLPMNRTGKKAAGRILDGHTHDEYPA